MGHKFSVGSRNEAHVPEFLSPSPPPRVFPELREAEAEQRHARQRETARRRVSAQGDARLLHQIDLAHLGLGHAANPAVPALALLLNWHIWDSCLARTACRYAADAQRFRERSMIGKQLAAVCRINALWRLRCCALAVGGFGEGDRSAFALARVPLFGLSFSVEVLDSHRVAPRLHF